MKPFTTYSGLPDSYYTEKAEGFYFIKIVTKTNGDNLSAVEKAYFDELISKAKTSEERSHIIEMRNYPESASGLSGMFFIVLVTTIFLFWFAAYISVETAKWIVRGFKNSDK